MILKELLTKADRGAAMAFIRDHFGMKTEGFERALDTLLLLDPTASDMVLHIDRCDDDHYEIIGKYADKEDRYSIEFTPWSKCLAMEVDPSFEGRFTIDEMAARCVWELTFHGYEEKSIRELVDELDRRVEEVRKNPELCVPHDEAFRRIKDDLEKRSRD